nr:ORF2 [Torque teno arctocephalus australis virus]
MENPFTLWKVTFDLLYDDGMIMQCPLYPLTGMSQKSHCFWDLSAPEFCLCLAWLLLSCGFLGLLIFSIQLLSNLKKLNGNLNALGSTTSSVGAGTFCSTLNGLQVPRQETPEMAEGPDLEEPEEEVPLLGQEKVLEKETSSPTRNYPSKED